MNLGEVKIRVKRQFGDEAQVQISDSDIIRWVNDGQRHIVAHNETINQKEVTSDLVNGQQLYTLPTDLFILNSAYIKYTDDRSYFHMKALDLQKFNEYINGWDGESYNKSRPVTYCKFDKSLRLFPIPDVDVIAGLKLLYARLPNNISDNTDDIDLPIEYHNSIVDYCLQKAYELDEDWQASETKGNHIQTMIHLNRDRELTTSQDQYSTITVLAEDAW